MIYVIAPSEEAGRTFLDRMGVDGDDALYLTHVGQAQGRILEPGDQTYFVAGGSQEIFFELTCPRSGSLPIGGKEE